SFWTLATITVSLVSAFFLKVTVTAIRSGSNVEITLQLTSVMLSFVLMLLFLFPTVTLWRLIIYRTRTQRTLGYQVPTVIPPWMLWLAATICSIILLLWLVRRLLLVISLIVAMS